MTVHLSKTLCAAISSVAVVTAATTAIAEGERHISNGDLGGSTPTRDSFLPQKSTDPSNPNTVGMHFIRSPAEHDRMKQNPGKTLRNLSFTNDIDRSHGTETFDASTELGILNDEAIISKEQMIGTDRELVDSMCDGYHPRIDSNVNFRSIVDRCLDSNDCQYGKMVCWNTSGVKDMSNAFEDRSTFNEPIGNWDTSAVTDMSNMFRGASSFNQPLDNFDTSSVTSMKFMFGNAKAFDQSIGNWDTSSVNDMSWMFRGAHKFNMRVGVWDTSAATDTSWMFSGAESFNQPIGGWITTSITAMDNMFDDAKAFNQPLKFWTTTSVKDMRWMFYAAEAFNQDISAWETKSVTDMSWMFNKASAFNQPLNSWDISSVTTMHHMFYDSSAFNQCLSTWATKTGSVDHTDGMFEGTSCPFTEDPKTGTGPWCQDITADGQCESSLSIGKAISDPSSGTALSSLGTISALLVFTPMFFL